MFETRHCRVELRRILRDPRISQHVCSQPWQCRRTRRTPPAPVWGRAQSTEKCWQMRVSWIEQQFEPAIDPNVIFMSYTMLYPFKIETRWQKNKVIYDGKHRLSKAMFIYWDSGPDAPNPLPPCGRRTQCAVLNLGHPHPQVLKLLNHNSFRDMPLFDPTSDLIRMPKSCAFLDSAAGSEPWRKNICHTRCVDQKSCLRSPSWPSQRALHPVVSTMLPTCITLKRCWKRATSVYWEQSAVL